MLVAQKLDNSYFYITACWLLLLVLVVRLLCVADLLELVLRATAEPDFEF